MGLFLFDATNAESTLQYIPKQVQIFKQFASKNARGILICNKCDLATSVPSAAVAAMVKQFLQQDDFFIDYVEMNIYNEKMGQVLEERLVRIVALSYKQHVPQSSTCVIA